MGFDHWDGIEGLDAGKIISKRDVMKRQLEEYLNDEVFAARFLDCMDLIRAKNADYTEGNQKKDRIKHFRQTAEELDLPMKKVWSVFVRKHWSAIQKYVKFGQTESEPIDGRINDVINYLVLFGAIVSEEQAK